MPLNAVDQGSLGFSLYCSVQLLLHQVPLASPKSRAEVRLYRAPKSNSIQNDPIPIPPAVERAEVVQERFQRCWTGFAL